MNVLQENLLRGGQRYMRPSERTAEGRYVAPRRARTREVTSIDGQKALNRALWTLGEKMRELKQAA